MAIGDADRAALHLLFVLHQVLVCGTALRVGARLPALRWASVVVAGPTSRAAWATGRLGGAAGLLLAQTAALAVLALLVAPRWGATSGQLATFYGLLWVEALVWTGVAAAVRCWARPWVAVSVGALVGVVGHLQDEYLRALGTWGLEGLATAVWAVLPGLDLLASAGWSAAPDPTRVVLAALHGGAWAVVLAAVVVASVQRRDLL